MSVLTRWEGEPVRVWGDRWGIPDLEVHDVLPSTNDRARERAEQGAAPMTTVMAEAQSSGRGRGASSWLSAPGAGLWMSVLFPGGSGVAPHLPLTIGLVVSRAIEYVTGFSVGLEWPNDVLIEGRKVAGILCEGASVVTVVGIGVNVTPPLGGFPKELASRAGALSTEGPEGWSRAALATAILDGLRRVSGSTGRRIGATDLRDLERRDTLRGHEVVSSQRGRGIARGIAPDGALLLERPDGTRVRVVAGSVTPVPVGPTGE